MAEHLHGYPRCETPAGTSCTSSDLHWDECKNHGALRTCEASVVDGIPTGQYHCSHDEAAPAPAKKAAARRKARPKKAGKAKAKPKKKAAARRGKKSARKPARKSRRAAKKKGAARRGGKRGARKKK